MVNKVLYEKFKLLLINIFPNAHCVFLDVNLNGTDSGACKPLSRGNGNLSRLVA